MENKRMHHANIVISKEDSRIFVFDMLEKHLNFKVKGNPDFLLTENISFGIDDARDLERWAIGKPFTGETKVSLILTKTITFEAQNALLKVLEEPSPGTYFFINLESLGGLLPTFMSRVRVIYAFEDEAEKEGTAKNALKFYKSDIKGRFTLIRSLSKKEDKAEALELLKDLENIYYENYMKKPLSAAESAKSMKNILAAKVFASSRGSSPKMLLEWLACMVPSSKF